MISSNHHSSATWVGDCLNNDTTKRYIEDCRKVLSDTNFRLVIRGRNPNRQQFRSLASSSLRRSIPIKYSTYFGLYLRRKNGGALDKTLWEARGRVQAVKTIYRHNLIFI